MRKIKAVPTTPQSMKVLSRTTAHGFMGSLLNNPMGPIIYHKQPERAQVSVAKKKKEFL